MFVDVQKKIYKDQVELMMVNHVYPEFNSPHGYLRARVSLFMANALCLAAKQNELLGLSDNAVLTYA
jgi:hypothetical protein